MQLEEDMNINEAGIDITVDSETQQGKPYGVEVEIQTVTTRPGRKYGMRKALTPSPPPRPPSSVSTPKQDRTIG